jgi:hypothetical protein
MSKPGYYYSVQEQQRKASPWMILFAIIFIFTITIGFACLGLRWADTQMSQVEFVEYPPHAFQGLFLGLLGGACIGLILAILIVLGIGLWLRHTD